jgi:hypothetical protein
LVNVVLTHYLDPQPLPGITDVLRDLPRHARVKQTHRFNELDRTKHIILIDFDSHDYETMTRLMVHNSVKPRLEREPDWLTRRWGKVFAGVSDLADIEHIFLNNQEFLLFPNWNYYVERIDWVLKLRFREVLFGNVNAKIAGFLKTEPVPQIDNLLFAYREQNRRHIRYQ